jgi:L-rhamnose mutarotase
MYDMIAKHRQRVRWPDLMQLVQRMHTFEISITLSTPHSLSFSYWPVLLEVAQKIGRLQQFNDEPHACEPIIL